MAKGFIHVGAETTIRIYASGLPQFMFICVEVLNISFESEEARMCC
jgi:hypothetical protein